MNRANEWCEVATDDYLDKRHRNWVLAEEMGDVVFVAARGVVLVHRERAEHIVRTLLGDGDVLLLEGARPLPARTGVRAMRVPPPQPPVIEHSSTRWRDILGWIGIVAGAGVFVTALAVPLDDPALVVALAMGLRGGRLVLDVDD